MALWEIVVGAALGGAISIATLSLQLHHERRTESKRERAEFARLRFTHEYDRIRQAEAAHARVVVLAPFLINRQEAWPENLLSDLAEAIREAQAVQPLLRRYPELFETSERLLNSVGAAELSAMEQVRHHVDPATFILDLHAQYFTFVSAFERLAADGFFADFDGKAKDARNQYLERLRSRAQAAE